MSYHCTPLAFLLLPAHQEVGNKGQTVDPTPSIFFPAQCYELGAPGLVEDILMRIQKFLSAVATSDFENYNLNITLCLPVCVVPIPQIKC